MSEVSDQQFLTAIEAFRGARWRATLEQVQARLTGKSADLLSYETVRDAIGARETAQRHLQEIPLEAIVGSVGRYKDFSRSFLPRVEEDEQRWARVWARMETPQGLPPIEVYQIGESYFVRDGNHRVSITRQQGAAHIEAYVTEVATRFPLTADIKPEAVILQARYTRFLEETALQTAVPDIDLTMSVAGNYRVLQTQIQLHQHWLTRQSNKAVAYAAAAKLWYDTVYWPVIQFIRQRGILRDFPDRTETDLYVWIDKHRQELAAHLGWSIDAATAVLDLADKQAPASTGALRRFGKKLRGAMTPALLEAGPSAGEWRTSWLATYRDDRLFSHILVAIDGKEGGWRALQQAVRVAWREQGKLFGLHVVKSEKGIHRAAARNVKAEFERRCQEAGIPGELTITTGPTVGTLCYRAQWADLVVVSLNHPPGPGPVQRLESNFGQLLRRCPRPVMAVPRTDAGLDRILLAYDGSPKAEEALYVTAYLAGQWRVPLLVVVALGKKVTEETVETVQTYLVNQDIQAQIIAEERDPAPLILETARAYDCGLIVMGGYSHHPVLEIVVGSAVDELLRTRNRPLLICR